MLITSLLSSQSALFFRFDEVKEQGFSFYEIESLKGIMILGIKLTGCLHIELSTIN